VNDHFRLRALALRRPGGSLRHASACACR